MFQVIVKAFIFFIMTSQVSAVVNKKEVYLKEMNSRLTKLLRDSYEAQVFLEEDLSDALKFVENSNIVWTDEVTSIPYFSTTDGISTLFLSSHLSFLGTEDERIENIVQILFSLQRQLTKSKINIPDFRIKLFSRKFSPMLLGEKFSCQVSLFPLSQSLPNKQREEFLEKLLSLLNKLGYEYRSKWAGKILRYEIKQSSDAECSGNNRNILKVTALLLDVISLKEQEVGQIEMKKCGFDRPELAEGLIKLTKQLKHKFPYCGNH